MIKRIIFDLDDTLFDSTDIVARSRMEACKAMINTGLKARSVPAVYKKLLEIVKKLGTHSQNHYNELVRNYNGISNTKIIAAGVVAYHDVKFSQLKLYPRTRELLARLLERGYSLLLVTRGVPFKQWEKILRLDISEFFKRIIIVDSSRKRTKKDVFLDLKKRVARKGVKPQEVVAIGNNLASDIWSSNKAGFISVRVLQGKYKNQKPKNKPQSPDYSIQKIGEFDTLLRRIEKK